MSSSKSCRKINLSCKNSLTSNLSKELSKKISLKSILGFSFNPYGIKSVFLKCVCPLFSQNCAVVLSKGPFSENFS